MTLRIPSPMRRLTQSLLVIVAVRWRSAEDPELLLALLLAYPPAEIGRKALAEFPSHSLGAVDYKAGR